MKISDSLVSRLKNQELPMIPLRDIIVFPHMIVPFFVGRKRSVRAIEEAMGKNRSIFLTNQKDKKIEVPSENDVSEYGTIARILQILKLPDGTIRVLVEGSERAKIEKIIDTHEFLKANIKVIKAKEKRTPTIMALIRSIKKEFSRYAEILRKIPKEVQNRIDKIETPNRLIDTICASSPFDYKQKLNIISITETEPRLEALLSLLLKEIEMTELQKTISSRVKKKLEKNQKNYFLHQQLKEIQKELGRVNDDPSGAKELEEKLKAKNLPEYVLQKCLKESRRLSLLQPMSPESGVLRTYLEWISDLPWNEFSEDNKDIEKANQILDEDHYGLEKVKERILDFIAVRQLKEKAKGPILCFIGPPGTGKTSLGRSVARSLGREFVRISLGGVRDEAEIRGHRKTYIGALPGKIIQSMRKANTCNPVFLLDEVDKMSSDFRGDPAAALLEVLDPEQNVNFMDHYLEVAYDLSHVMFITTANTLHNIPYPLRDRMEVIEISGYTEYEKEKIAQQFLIPKQQDENGLDWARIAIEKEAVYKIIRFYTMESGVRNLERQIANIMRKIAREAVKKGIIIENENRVLPEEKDNFQVTITENDIDSYLGKEKYYENGLGKELKTGLAYGLAWTELGGTILPIEVALLIGKGELLLTGSLGDVMKESAQTALSFLRANTKELNIPLDFYKEKDVHLHVPEGAIPKDGPSAGITIIAAMLSAIKGKCVKKQYAMTGEITLTGRLLAIGGVKEKVLAAIRNKMTNVLLPEKNRKDIEELPEEVKSGIKFTFASSIKEALGSLFPKNIWK
jgi:ATP-dependent Lon protease